MTKPCGIDEPVIVTLTPVEGTPQRIRLEPTDRPGVELHIEQQICRGYHWHTTGAEYIEISGYQSPIEPNPADEGVSRDP